MTEKLRVQTSTRPDPPHQKLPKYIIKGKIAHKWRIHGDEKTIYIHGHDFVWLTYTVSYANSIE